MSGSRLEIHFGQLIGAKRRKKFLLLPLKFAFWEKTNPANRFLGGQVPNPLKHYRSLVQLKFNIYFLAK